MTERDDEFREIKDRLRGDGMQISEKRDPWTIGAVLFGVLVQVGMWVSWGGRIDQRVETLEKRADKSDAKDQKDAIQDTQIAVVSSQLATINSHLGEIKARLEAR